MTSFRAVALAVVSATLVMGCGKSSSNSKEELNAQTFAAAAADEVCSALVACSCTDQSALADCKTAYGEVASLFVDVMIAGNPGTKIDPAAAQTCLDDVKAALATCPSPTQQMSSVKASARLAAVSGAPIPINIDSCMSMFVGTQTADDSCGSSSACAPGLSCDERTRTCQTSAALDASCQYIDCADGLYCNPSQLCKTIPGLNQACPDSRCQDGLECVTVDTVLTCKGPHAIGENCTDGAGCVTGAFCSTTCQALAADGADCLNDSDCLHGWCNTASKCADAGFCSLLNEIKIPL